MDEINKAIEEENLGPYIDYLNENIGCLLWMDDFVLISFDENELQRMLDITYEIACKYRIEFGKEKSKLLVIGPKDNIPEFKLGDMILEICDFYKYLGIILNSKYNMDNHIKSIKGKTEAAYQTILSIAGNEQFKGIEMETIWEMTENTIIAIITYACDTWQLSEKETIAINSILDNIIRRILMVPKSTPRELLYIETGLLDPSTISKKQKIMTNYKMTNSTSTRNQKIANHDGEGTWKEKIDEIKQKTLINDSDLTGKISTVKSKVKRKIMESFKIDLMVDSIL